MRLAVTGYQDTFLTGDPQKSFYQKVFTKRSGYTTENLRLAFDSDIRFGGTSRCTIDNDTCDIITSFVLNFTFQESQTVPQDAGHAFVERADLIVGGQTIVSLTGEYMAVISDLTDTQRTRNSNDAILKRNVTPTSYGTTSVTNQFLVEVPFFGKGFTNAFPLLALNRHTIEVRITLRKQSELSNVPLPDVVLDLQAIYLNEEHRQFFLGKQLDYVIKQTQLARVTLGDLNQIRFKTLFENPIQEFILVVQNDSGTKGVFDYSSAVNPANYSSYSNDQVTRWRLFLNGQVYFDLDQMTMRAIQPYEYYVQTPSYKVNIFNIGSNTGPYPSGTVNMSRISSQIFELILVNNSVSRKARLYAVNFNVFRCQGGLGGTIFV
jgi:hypothetical protein